MNQNLIKMFLNLFDYHLNQLFSMCTQWPRGGKSGWLMQLVGVSENIFKENIVRAFP